ncbi:MAG: phage tail protein [Candidatus Electrothrix sp. ATG1]|nr:phage tail protein [Candidatus Electrothrix sp. ATG1]
MAYRTPGVYVEEISLFPPSVAEVETAIPAFIGYTEKAEKRGEDLTNTPTRIKSLLEFNELFGGEFEVEQVDVIVDKSNNYAVKTVTPTKRFYLYESLRLFFDNGGGKCYIVSVGRYKKDGDVPDVLYGDPTQEDQPGLLVGLKALEKYDEPTMLLFPDAPLMTGDNELYNLQQAALKQCADLQDRVGVFDLKVDDIKADDFRNKIGMNNLKYGAAYTPWLYSGLPKTVDFGIFKSSVKISETAPEALKLEAITTDSKLNDLVKIANIAVKDLSDLKEELAEQIKIDATKSYPSLQDKYLDLQSAITQAKDDTTAKEKFTALLEDLLTLTKALAGWKISITGKELSNDVQSYDIRILKLAVIKLIKKATHADAITLSGIKKSEILKKYDVKSKDSWIIAEDVKDPDTTEYTGTDLEKCIQIAAGFEEIFSGKDSISSFIKETLDSAKTHMGFAQQILYEKHPIIDNIANRIKKELAIVPPSGAVAGVYATVDRTRGVWKAPANVSLNSVLGPVEAIDDSDQGELNIDVTAGKSINAIRAFTGKGTLVWGARTLAGNDKEWRYIPVRRFYNMVEESIKKSTAWAVFEPNDASLWTKVKGMIDNYLIQKWREGALAGATPEEAFFVKIGLGQTMTPQHILEGKLIVEIRMAVVRPAEFIILKFSHKMQES